MDEDLRMKIEVNGNKVVDDCEGKVIGEDYWIARVHLYEDQYLLAFPKFNTIGIGFAKEEDWNTNLPYTHYAEGILSHIWHNRRFVAIKKKQTLKAIKILKDYINLNKEKLRDDNTTKPVVGIS